MFQTLRDDYLLKAHSYETAVRCWEKARKIRDREERSLHKHRRTSSMVYRIGEAVCFRYHSTDIVRWEPERVVVTFWGSNSTVVFANCYLPSGLIARMQYCEMWVNGMQPKRGTISFVQRDDKWVPEDMSRVKVQYEVRSTAPTKQLKQLLAVVDEVASYHEAKRMITGDKGRGWVRSTTVLESMAEQVLRGEQDVAALAQLWTLAETSTIKDLIRIKYGSIYKRQLKPGVIPIRNAKYEAYRHLAPIHELEPTV